MGRLVPEALYNQLDRRNYHRNLNNKRNYAGPTDIVDYNKCWKNAPARIEQLDPDGRISYALMLLIEKDCKKKRKPKDIGELVNS
jgi:hypothetical protein